MMKRKATIEEKKYDNCVFCGGKTGIPTDLDIKFRANYVEGSGQLCLECHERVFKNKK